MRGLSPQQEQFMRVIGSYLRIHQFPPTMPQLQMACDIKSPGHIAVVLNILERKGLLTRKIGQQRGITLTEAGKGWLQKEEERHGR